QVGKPHLHRIISIESLLDKGIHKTTPNEDKSGSDGANHGKADKYVEEVKELSAEGLRHQQRNKDRAEQCGHAVKNEGAAIDHKEDSRRETQQPLHDEV